MRISIVDDYQDIRIPRLLGKPVRYADSIKDLESNKYTDTGILLGVEFYYGFKSNNRVFPVTESRFLVELYDGRTLRFRFIEEVKDGE